jgi:hypothetical protein
LGAIAILLSLGGAAFAGAIATPPAETVSTVLIGAGLLLTGCIARRRTGRG